MGINEMDRPLNFHGNSEIAETPFSAVTRNSTTIWAAPSTDIDAVTSFARSQRQRKDISGAEFGSSGGQAASRYAGSVRKSMHHECEYSPCRRLSPEEYEKLK